MCLYEGYCSRDRHGSNSQRYQRKGMKYMSKETSVSELLNAYGRPSTNIGVSSRKTCRWV